MVPPFVLPMRSRARIFEVDHPATQAWKRERLAAGEISVSPTLTFVPLDFERQDLAAELSGAGLQHEATFFSWLGGHALPFPRGL